MKTITLLFLDSITTVRFDPVQKSIHTFNKMGRLTYLLGWAHDLRSVQERIITLLPSVQKGYVIETKIYKNSRS